MILISNKGADVALPTCRRVNAIGGFGGSRPGWGVSDEIRLFPLKNEPPDRLPPSVRLTHPASDLYLCFETTSARLG